MKRPCVVSLAGIASKRTDAAYAPGNRACGSGSNAVMHPARCGDSSWLGRISCAQLAGSIFTGGGAFRWSNQDAVCEMGSFAICFPSS